jgi:hypothetical protein
VYHQHQKDPSVQKPKVVEEAEELLGEEVVEEMRQEVEDKDEEQS